MQWRKNILVHVSLLVFRVFLKHGVLEVELLGQSSLRLFSDSGSGVPSEKLQLHFQQ